MHGYKCISFDYVYPQGFVSLVTQIINKFQFWVQYSIILITSPPNLHGGPYSKHRPLHVLLESYLVAKCILLQAVSMCIRLGFYYTCIRNTFMFVFWHELSITTGCMYVRQFSIVLRQYNCTCRWKIDSQLSLHASGTQSLHHTRISELSL